MRVRLRKQKLSRLETEREAHPDLAVLDAQVVEQDRLYKHAVIAANETEGGLRAKESVLASLEKRMSGLQEALLSVALTPFQLTGLDERLAQIPIPIELERVDEIVGRLERGIGAERTGLLTRIGEHEKKVERCFQTFVTTWPAEARGLDPSIESAPDFFSKLARLIGDGLPEYEERFLRLLHGQSDQNLTRLSAQLDQERKAIRDRMDLVNESLKTAPYNPGTHLVIETTDRMLDDVRQFKQSLKASLSHSFSVDPLMAERRFEVTGGKDSTATTPRSRRFEVSSWRSWRLRGSCLPAIEVAADEVTGPKPVFDIEQMFLHNSLWSLANRTQPVGTVLFSLKRSTRRLVASA